MKDVFCFKVNYGYKESLNFCCVRVIAHNSKEALEKSDLYMQKLYKKEFKHFFSLEIDKLTEKIDIKD